MTKLIRVLFLFLLKNKIFFCSSNLTLSKRSLSNTEFKIDDFHLDWTDQGNTIRLKLKVSNFTSSNVWAGIAFSRDRMMGDDDTIICKTFNGENKIERSYLTGKSRPSLLNESKPKLGLSNLSISFKNGILTCNITRLKASRNKKVLNARNRFHILLAKGRTDINGNCLYHGSKRFVSESFIQLNKRKRKIKKNQF